MLATTLALVALAISVLTFVLSYRANTAAERRSRLPGCWWLSMTWTGCVRGGF